MTLGQWMIAHRSGWLTIQQGSRPPLIHWRGWWVMYGCTILPLAWLAVRLRREASVRPDRGEGNPPPDRSSH